eukprot:766567_1
MSTQNGLTSNTLFLMLLVMGLLFCLSLYPSTTNVIGHSMSNVLDTFSVNNITIRDSLLFATNTNTTVTASSFQGDLPTPSINTRNINVKNNDIFLFNNSCNSFPNICQSLHLNDISSLNDFDIDSDAINHALSWSNISRLFILSFRREYMFMLNAYNLIPTLHNTSRSSNIYYTILTKLTAPIHSPHLSLFHTHVSKAMGTTLSAVSKVIATRLNITSMPRQGNKIGYGVSDIAYTGMPKYHLPNESCQHLYQRIVESNKQYRIETEKPLTNNKLCPQFYNSIALREPIDHRLSVLAYKNLVPFRHEFGGILCTKSKKKQMHMERQLVPVMHRKIRTNVNWKNYAFCDDANAYEGFLNILFNESNIGELADKQRISKQEIIPYSQWYKPSHESSHANESNLLIEWIDANANNKRFSIEHVLTKGYHPNASQNTSCWMGFLSNTYVRWLGYKHKDSHVVMDALYEYVFNINRWHLEESKRVLLQYDYVLPSGVPQDSSIWTFYLIEMHRIMMQTRSVKQFLEGLNNGSLSLIVDNWNKQSRVNQNSRLSTSLLKQVFQLSGELPLLQKLNALDDELYEYSKQIAKMDKQFYEVLYQY